MAGQTTPNKPQETPAAVPTTMAALAAMGLSTNEGASAPIFEYFKLQLKKELEAERLKEEQERQEKQVKLEGAEAANRERKMKEAKQIRCDHRREDGKPYTGGVKTSSGVVSISCAGCDKVWEGNEFDIQRELGRLYPPDTRMTGPVT
jgi:hypothetical protein